MSTCNDCYNLFMCMQKNPQKYEKNWENDTICSEFEDDQLEYDEDDI